MVDLKSLSPDERRLLLYREDPASWVEDVLGDQMWSKQVEIFEAVAANRDTSVASCHGAGKSWTAARVALWFCRTRYPAIVITTAPTDRQVRGILWKEIRLAHQRALSPMGGKLLTQELKWADDWWIWGFTAPDYDPDRFQGFHEEHILVIVDEASGVSKAIYDGISGILSSDQARILRIGNPTDPSGEFAQSFNSKYTTKIRISAFDTPNFTTFGITNADIPNRTWAKKITGPLPYPQLVTPRWVAERFEKWGEESPLYQARVLGQFPQQGDDTLIPISWIEAARQRELEAGSPVEVGADVARYGGDETTIYIRRGDHVRLFWAGHKTDTMTTTGHIVRAIREAKAERARVDVVGIGSGVVDRLEEMGHEVFSVNTGEGASDNKRFLNARAEWWWGMRERFERGDIDIEDDEDLIAQLSSLRYKVTSKGQIQIERKEDARKRGISSPDRADGVMHCFAERDGFLFV